MNKIRFSLSLLGLTACLSMPVSAAVYFGTDTSGGAVNTGTLDWTFEATNPGTPAGGADVGKAAGTSISESHLLDGNDNHSSFSGESAAPFGFSNNWTDSVPASILWTVDMKRNYDIHKIIMRAGSGNTYYGMVGAVIEVSSDGTHWTPIGTTAGIKNGSGTFPSGTTWSQDAHVGADVTGQYLRITADGFSHSGPVKMDQMDLYVSPAPEPGSLGILTFGGLILAGRRRRASH